MKKPKRSEIHQNLDVKILTFKPGRDIDGREEDKPFAISIFKVQATWMCIPLVK